MDEAMRPIRSNWQVVAFQRNNEDGRRRALADEYAKREQKKSEGTMPGGDGARFGGGREGATRCGTSSTRNYYKHNISD